MNALSVSTVCAVFLASNLAQDGLARRANFVHHPVLELVSANSASDDRNFLLGSLTGFPHRGQMLLLIGHLLSPDDESSLSQFVQTRTQPLPYLMLNPSDFRSIIFCEPNLGRV